jgi:hypothetical protein
MQNPETKEALAALCKILIQSPDVRFFIFLSDSWTRVVKEEEMKDLDMSQGVKNMPGRKEAISVTVYDCVTQKTHGGTWPYDRDDQGHPQFLPFEWMVDAEINSRFTPLDRQVQQ